VYTFASFWFYGTFFVKHNESVKFLAEMEKNKARQEINLKNIS